MKHRFSLRQLAVLTTALMLTLAVLVGCTKTTSDDAYNKSGIDEAAVENTANGTSDAAASTDTTVAVTPSTVEPTSYPLEITNKDGSVLRLTAEPTKVISLSPEFTETIYALDAGDKLIGRSTYCDYPEAAKALPEMGTLFELNVEAIVAAAPDLVVLSSMAPADLMKSLTDQGLNVLAVDYDSSFDKTYEYIAQIGYVLNKNAEAEATIQDMQARIKAVAAKVANLDKPLTYFVVGAGEYGDSTATGDTFIARMIEIAGGENAAADGSNWQYSLEQLVTKDPTILICSASYGMKDQITALEGYKDLTAVKEGRLYEVEENLFFRQGPRVADGVEALAKILHPEAFQ